MVFWAAVVTLFLKTTPPQSGVARAADTVEQAEKKDGEAAGKKSVASELFAIVVQPMFLLAMYVMRTTPSVNIIKTRILIDTDTQAHR